MNKDVVRNKDRVTLLLSDGKTQEFSLLILAEDGGHTLRYSATTEMWEVKIFLVFRPVYNKNRLPVADFHKLERERLYKCLREVFSKAYKQESFAWCPMRFFLVREEPCLEIVIDY